MNAIRDASSDVAEPRSILADAYQTLSRASHPLSKEKAEQGTALEPLGLGNTAYCGLQADLSRK